MARFCHSCGVKATPSEIWIILAWSIFKAGHNFISQPPLQSLPEAGNSIDSRFFRVVGWLCGLLYCNWKTAVPKWVGGGEWLCNMREGHPVSLGRHGAWDCCQAWWLSPAFHNCHVIPRSGADLWHHAGYKWLPLQSKKYKQRAGTETLSPWLSKKSIWIVKEQKLISRTEITVLVLTERMEGKHRAKKRQGINRQECDYFSSH